MATTSPGPTDLPMDRKAIRDLLRRLIPKEQLCREVWDLIRGLDGPLALACSGGIDSVALLHILWSRTTRQGNLLVLHFDHAVRGEESAADAHLVRSLAKTLDLPFILGTRNPADGPTTESALRRARLDFFHGEMARRNVTHLATGHQLDDAIETLLLRLARGSGLEGLVAPRPVQYYGGQFIHLRPLIGVRKKTLRTFLERLQIPWREDASNESMDHFRNRVRHRLLPLWSALEDRRDLVRALDRSRELLAEDALFLEKIARETGRRLSVGIGLDSMELRRIDRPIRRRILLHFLLERGCQNGRAAVDLALRKLDRPEPFKISIGPDTFLLDDGKILSIRTLAQPEVVTGQRKSNFRPGKNSSPPAS